MHEWCSSQDSNYFISIFVDGSFLLVSFQNMKPLDAIANYYGTDKRSAEHNYVQYYEAYFSPFRQLPLSLVEIGIYEHFDKAKCPYAGASLRMWSEYFYSADIHGLDIVDYSHLDWGPIQTHVADQSDTGNLRHIFEKESLRPNIIIDDGSHDIAHQQISFGALFKYLRSGGYYVIEDITQYDLTHAESRMFVSPAQFHGNRAASPLTFSSVIKDNPPLSSSTLAVLLSFCSTGKLRSPFISDDDAKFIEENINFCNIHKSNMLNLYVAFIQKK